VTAYLRAEAAFDAALKTFADNPAAIAYKGSVLISLHRFTEARDLAQGVLATIGYAIAGVPEPIFFGAATAVASLVPAVGTMLVWVPAGISLILVGHTGHGIFELAWGGLFVVAFSDYVIRPRLVGGESEVPLPVTFAALFGGVEVFGLKGLIIGPVLMSVAVAVLRLYATETRLRRHLPPTRSIPPS